MYTGPPGRGMNVAFVAVSLQTTPVHSFIDYILRACQDLLNSQSRQHWYLYS